MNTIKTLAILCFFILGSAFVHNRDHNTYLEKSDASVIKILNSSEVYPNPAEDFIYLKINDSELRNKIEIEVMSIIGTKMNISYEKVGRGLYKINVKNIPAGNFYVMLTIDTDQALKRFIKR